MSDTLLLWAEADVAYISLSTPQLIALAIAHRLKAKKPDERLEREIQRRFDYEKLFATHTDLVRTSSY